MRAAGYSVDRPYDKGSVRVLVRAFAGSRVSVPMAMRVVVHVRRSIMGVGVRMQTRLQAAPQSPDPDPNQEHTDKTFGPARKRFDREQFTSNQRQQANE